MNSKTHIFETPGDVASEFARYFAKLLAEHPADKTFNVALSGGSTPNRLFELWAAEYCETFDWSRVHFFWGDERCVAPDDEQSNYRVVNELFFQHCGIAQENIHRVVGESAPYSEAERYAEEICDCVPVENGLPVFSLVILGMGADGHTASIFPHESNLLKSDSICAVATHPESGQRRVTLTGPVINAAEKVVALVTGESKAEVLSSVLAGEGMDYPIAHIRPESGLEFYLDRAAATKP